MDDFYATLGVSPNAPLAEIKDRYRFLAHAYHPDKFSTDAHKRDAGEAFKKINEAFQTLSNPSLRADYDKWRTSGSANEPKSSPPPPRPASERPPPQTPPSPRTKRPGTIKYLMAAIFWSITGGMLGALAGPLGALAGVVVGLWFGIWVCNREPKPHAAPPPQQKPQPAPPSGREWSLAVFIAFLVVIVGAFVVAWQDRPEASPTTSRTAPQKDDWGGTLVTEPSASPKPAIDPTTAKPIPAPPTGFELDAAAMPAKAAPLQRTGGSFVAPQEDIDAASRSATKDRPFVNSLGMKFVPVPGAAVLFCIWDTRVQDYEVFARESQREWPKPDFRQGPKHPAVNVSWEDAQAFCAWLSKKEGQTYRLPTSAEWSAAVGPATYPWGTAWPPPNAVGNYAPSLGVDIFERTSPVGSFPPNSSGLCDMGGNVWQWCEDEYRASLNNDGAPNRVARGASWYYDVSYALRSSYICYAREGMRFTYFGFRVVLVVPSP